MYVDKDQMQSWIQTNPLNVTNQPTFYAYTVDVPQNIDRVYMSLNPFIDSSQVGTVYYFSPILTPGNFDPQAIPKFTNTSDSKGIWSGHQFNNLVRNAGATETWPKFRSIIYQVGGKIDARLSQGIGWLIYSLDLKGTAWYIKATSSALFRSFWAKFGWGQIALIGSKPYRWLLIASFLSLIGSIVGIRRKFNWSGFRFVLWLLINLILSIGYAWFTGISMGSYIARAYIAVARFIYPSIIVIMTVLTFGWSNLIELIPGKYCTLTSSLLIAGFLCLDAYSIFSVLHYFQGI
jgi:hypothetical protein